MSRISFSLATLALSGACAAAVGDGSLADPAATTQESQESVAPVVATLQLRDQTLTLSSTPNGVRYQVVDASGTRSELTLEELEAFAPQLAELVRSAYARRQPRLDARLDTSVASGPTGALPWAGRAPR